MTGLRVLIFVGIGLWAGLSYAVAGRELPASSIIDEKEFQRASAEPGEVAYARVMEEQNAIRKAAEERVRDLHQMSPKEIRAYLAQIGDEETATRRQPSDLMRDRGLIEDVSFYQKQLHVLSIVFFVVVGLLLVWWLLPRKLMERS